jgi:hypothetical protein
MLNMVFDALSVWMFVFLVYGLIILAPLSTVLVVMTVLRRWLGFAGLAGLKALFYSLLLTILAFGSYYLFIFWPGLFRADLVDNQPVWGPRFLYRSAYLPPFVLMTMMMLASYGFWRSAKGILARKKAAVIGVLFTTSVGLFIYFSLGMINPCTWEATDHFHFFNGHLNSLCIERDDLSECPRDEGALAAFNPERWRQFNQCAVITYSFDEQTEIFDFDVENSSFHLWTHNRDSHGYRLNSDQNTEK